MQKTIIKKVFNEPYFFKEDEIQEFIHFNSLSNFQRISSPRETLFNSTTKIVNLGWITTIKVVFDWKFIRIVFKGVSGIEYRISHKHYYQYRSYYYDAREWQVNLILVCNWETIISEDIVPLINTK